MLAFPSGCITVYSGMCAQGCYICRGSEAIVDGTKRHETPNGRLCVAALTPPGAQLSLVTMWQQ